MGYENTFCMEHSSRTCCNAEDTNKIKLNIGLVKLKTDITEQCLALTTKIACSRCDGDVVIVFY